MVINKHFQQKPTTTIVQSNNTYTRPQTQTHTYTHPSHTWQLIQTDGLARDFGTAQFIRRTEFIYGKEWQKYYIVSFIAISYLRLSTSVFARVGT